MLSYLPFILMIASAIILLGIVVRHFAQLSLFKVDTLPEVQIAQKKISLWRLRSEKRAQIKWEKWKNLFRPVGKSARTVQKKFRQYVGQVERKLLSETHHTLPIEVLEKTVVEEDGVRRLLSEAQFALDNDDTVTAEQKFLAAIRLDQAQPDIYRGLAAVYEKTGQDKEAEETYKFVLRLAPNDETTFVRLGSIAEERGNTEEAISWYQQAVLVNDSVSLRFFHLAELLRKVEQYQTALEAARQAVELEPSNPKYLDIFIEIAILAKEKSLAEAAWKELRNVNSENQKLAVFKDAIEGI